MITLRHPVNKFIGAGSLTCLYTFFICSVRIAPAKVIQDGAGKQGVFLKHYGNLIPEDLCIVLSHIYTPYTD